MTAPPPAGPFDTFESVTMSSFTATATATNASGPLTLTLRPEDCAVWPPVTNVRDAPRNRAERRARRRHGRSRQRV